MMQKVLTRRCPVCNAERGTVKHTQDVAVPDELQFNTSFDVIACERCGFTFADIPNAQSDLDESYKQHSIYTDADVRATQTTVHAVADPPWDVDRLAGVADYIAALIPNRKSRVLDAGCSTGSFLGMLKERGFTSLWGLEPSPQATQTARRLHDVQAITGSFVTPPADIGTFDVIALSHVLEHLTEVRAAIRSLYRLLNPSGVAYVEVPDATHYADYLVAPYHDFNTEHINHFSLPVLRRLFDEAGFELVESAEKVIRCAEQYSYPAIFGVWRRPPPPVRTRSIASEYDSALVNGIDRYVRASGSLLEQIDRRLSEALTGYQDVIIWGAGQLAMKLLCDTILKEKNILAIVDGSTQKQGLHINGHVVVAPARVATLDAPIVVTSIHAEPAIVAAIRATLGDDRRIVSLTPTLMGKSAPR